MYIYINMDYIKKPYFIILDPRCKKVLIQNYPSGDFQSFVEYKYENSIRFTVKKYDGTTQVYYL